MSECLIPFPKWQRFDKHARAIQFFVPSEIQGKGRPRSALRNKKGGGHFVSQYTPKKTVEYENLIRLCASEAMKGETLILKPCQVELTMCVSTPASWPEAKKKAALDGVLMPTSKPDADNVLKAVCDAMNGIVWHDDVQAVVGGWVKIYSETPGIIVTVTEYNLTMCAQAATSMKKITAFLEGLHDAS